MKIKITCETKKYIPIDELVEFQGALKTITKDEIEKLKKSIVKYGFSFPVFIWNKNILDGHQRIAALESLIDDGYTCGDIPVVFIDAKNKKEAAEKLLLINSKYSVIDQNGFDAFVGDFEIDIIDIGELLNIPEIDLTLPDFEPSTEDDQGDLDQLKPKIIECPHCGEKINLREQE